MPPTAAVDIELKANVQQLIKALSQVENISERQAKALVRDIEKSNAAMERASNKAAKAQKRAFDRAAKEAQARADGMVDVSQKTATEIGSIFGIGLLGDLEGTFDIARQSTEKFGGSWVAAGAIATAAIAGALSAVRAFNDAQMQLISDVAAASDELEGYVSAATLKRMGQFTSFVKDADAAITLLKFGSDDLRGSLEGVKATQVGMVAAGFPEFLSSAVHKITEMNNSLGEGRTAWLNLIPAYWFAKVPAMLVGGVGDEVEELGQSAIDTAEAMRGLQKDLADDREYDLYLADLEAKAEADLKKLRDQDEKAKAARDKAAAAEARADATKQLAAATSLAAQAQAELNREIAEEERLQKQAFTALKAADKVGEAADARQFDARERIQAAYKKELQIIQKAIDLNGENAITTQAAASAQDAYNAAINELDQQELHAKIGLVAGAVTELAGAASTFAGLALDRFSELADANTARFEARVERQTEAQRAEIAAQLEAGEISEAVAESRLTALDLNEERRKKYHKALTKDQRKAANRAFAVSQAAAVAEVLASGAVAYMGLLASMSYLGFGAPGAAAAITAPAVAAQLAVVASAKPPQYSDGGMVTPDHRMISAQPGEAVISRRGVAALGGPTGIESLNRGMGAGQNVTANIVLDRRIIGQAVADLVPASMTRRSGRIAIYGG